MSRLKFSKNSVWPVHVSYGSYLLRSYLHTYFCYSDTPNNLTYSHQLRTSKFTLPMFFWFPNTTVQYIVCLWRQISSVAACSRHEPVICFELSTEKWNACSAGSLVQFLLVFTTNFHRWSSLLLSRIDSVMPSWDTFWTFQFFSDFLDLFAAFTDQHLRCIGLKSAESLFLFSVIFIFLRGIWLLI